MAFLKVKGKAQKDNKGKTTIDLDPNALYKNLTPDQLFELANEAIDKHEHLYCIKDLRHAIGCSKARYYDTLTEEQKTFLTEKIKVKKHKYCLRVKQLVYERALQQNAPEFIVKYVLLATSERSEDSVLSDGTIEEGGRDDIREAFTNKTDVVQSYIAGFSGIQTPFDSTN